MNITLRQLEITLKCIQEMHFSRAADKLCMTPAAVSKQISNLEQQLGFKLFKIIGKKVQLTQQCINIIPYLNKTLGAANELKLQATKNSVDKAKSIKVSLGPGLESIIFKKIQNFKCIYPQINFEIIINHDRSSQLKDLLEQKSDLYFSSRFYKNPKLEQQSAFNLDFNLVCARSNPLSKHKLSEALLKEQTYITTIPEQNLSKGYKKALLLDSYMSVKQAIIADLGIGLLPNNLLENENRLRKIGNNSNNSKSIFMTRLKSVQHHELDLFIDYMHSNAD